MPKYNVHFTGTASAIVEVEAESKKEAAEKAYEEMPGSICAQCSGWREKWSREWPDDMDIAEDDETGEELIEEIEA
jgi:hypothetical protein